MEYNLHLKYLNTLNEETDSDETSDESQEETGSTENKNSGGAKEAVKIIKEKVGGDFKSDSRRSSFDGIKRALDLLELSEIEENGEEIKEIFAHLTKKENIEFIDRFIRNQKGRTQSLGATIKRIKDTATDEDFKKEVNVMMNVIERVYKLHSILKNNLALISVSTEGEEKANESRINRLERSILNCEKTIAEKTKLIQDEGKKEIEEAIQLDDPIEAREKISQVEQTYAELGLKELVAELIRQVKGELGKKATPKQEEKDSAEVKKKASISRKKIVVNRLLEALRLAMLPELSGDEVKSGGDYYALYAALTQKNAALMNDVVGNKIFKISQSQERDAFRAKQGESGAEEDQLTYLNACREWIKQYVLSSSEGQIEAQRDIEKFLSQTDNIADEKEKEIRNYYTAKDFNLGQFKGLQIKPEIYLPLCLSRSRSEAECKIKLPVSYKDRVDESPLKKFYLAASSIVGGLFANIPDTGDKAFAAAMADRNQAIISGISSIISGTLGVFSKQASRDYEEGLANVKKRVKETFAKPESKEVREDMLAMPIQPATEPGQLLQTPDSVPSGMDTFALLGPGGTGKKSKKSTKKKKPMKTIPQRGGVLSFDDFLKRSKNIK